MLAPVTKSLGLVQLSRGMLWCIHDARFGCLNESVCLLIILEVNCMASVMVPFMFFTLFLYICILVQRMKMRKKKRRNWN